MAESTITTIDEYIAQYPEATRERLQAVRAAIRAAAPAASEKISWQMPTFYLNGNLIHFAINKRHIGIYPGPEAIAAFAAEFEKLGLHYSKGAVQFPLDQPTPFELLARIVAFCLAAQTQK